MSLNKTSDFGNYSDQAIECTNLFEGVYTYGCPESKTTAGFAECDAFRRAIAQTIANVNNEILERYGSFRMELFRNIYNRNIFKLRNGINE